MAMLRPFQAYRYSRSLGFDYSNLIAPPYDVLDEASKARLLELNEYNVVGVDLPHLPPKSVGPDETYRQAAETLQRWIADGVLERDHRAAFYPVEQTYVSHNRTYHRRGFFCLVRLHPFGTGEVIPHERTYAAPIEDRLKLMRATGMSLSPIFGLYHDPKNEVSSALFAGVGRPEISATLDGVKNDLWNVFDAGVEARVIDLMKGRPIYIADGHHRYTTALQYHAEVDREAGGSGRSPQETVLPASHPANYALFCLVSMQDAGLQVLATHRMIGGLDGFDIQRFTKAVEPHFVVKEALRMAGDEQSLLHIPQHGFGLYDGAAKKMYALLPKGTDPLKETHAEQSVTWRRLDVAVAQHYLIEQVLQPLFAGGREVVRGYTHEVSAAVHGTDGGRYQVALLLRATPLSALVELGKTGEVMPQKSTFFYPKLPTGLVMASLRPG
ncbi:MAG: DUF1015 domain-containing protein [Tepidisphaerales bacterium]